MKWTEERPWGRFLNLWEDPHTKVKLIEVDPGKRFSYQSHEKRQESWTIVRGEAMVTLNDKEYLLAVSEHVTISKGSKHRVTNGGNEALNFIEVQTGTYFGEDDIHRYEDDFGRAK